MAESESAKLINRSSLTPYDLLGYLVPGGMFLAAIAAFEAFVRQSSASLHPGLHTPVLTALTRLTNAAIVPGEHNIPVDAPWVIQGLIFILAGTVSYVMGHIVASFSALAIDRWYVDKAHGYPFRFMLDLNQGDKRSLPRVLHRTFFFWLNFYLLLRFFSLPKGLPLAELMPSVLSHWIPGALSPDHLRAFAAFVAWGLVMLATIMLLLTVDQKRDSPMQAWLLKRRFGLWVLIVIKGMILGAALPALLVTTWLGTYLHSREPLDPITCDLFKGRMLDLLGVSRASANTDKLLESSSTFWYSYIHLRTSPDIAQPVDNWLRLYGFARNLAAALYLSFLYCLCWWLFQGDRIVLTSIQAHYVILMLPLLYFVAAFLLLLRYYYLYVSYFTKYVLRGFVYLTRPVRA
jgi:hypothetical protein